jgi:hypothetical protein
MMMVNMMMDKDDDGEHDVIDMMMMNMLMGDG